MTGENFYQTKKKRISGRSLVLEAFSPAISIVGNFFFPKNCVLCSCRGIMLCDRCQTSLLPARLKCLACGKHNPYGVYCPGCKKRYKPDLVVSAFAYDDVVKKIVHEFKYNDVFQLASPLCNVLAARLKRDRSIDNFVTVPVPLHRKRLSHRGYNQAALIARHLSDILGISTVDILTRDKIGETQANLKSPQERRKNVRGVYSLKDRATVPENIILVDDVITSGATIEEISRLLKRNGARTIIGASVAMG